MKSYSLKLILMGIGLTLLASGCPRVVDLQLPATINVFKPSDEELIIALLNDVENGIETKRIYKVLAHVSKSYHDQEGRDYVALQNYLNHLFKEYRDIRITRTPPRVTVSGLRAQAFESFGTQAKPINPATGRSIDLQGHVTIYLEKIQDRWQIVEWGPLQ